MKKYLFYFCGLLLIVNTSCSYNSVILDEKNIDAITFDDYDKPTICGSVGKKAVIKKFIDIFNNKTIYTDNTLSLNKPIYHKLAFVDLKKLEFIHIFLDLKSYDILVFKNNQVIARGKNEQLVKLYLQEGNKLMVIPFSLKKDSKTTVTGGEEVIIGDDDEIDYGF